jgi:hypothetical protein
MLGIFAMIIESTTGSLLNWESYCSGIALKSIFPWV